MMLRHVREELRLTMQATKFPWNKSRTDISVASTTEEPLPEPVADVIIQCWDSYDWLTSSDALSDWYNARILKTGYSVSRELVHTTLTSRGRDAHMGLGDHLQGAFYRRDDIFAR